MDKADEMFAYSVLNYELALSRMDGDQELYEEVARVFLLDTPQQLAILRQALKEHDRITIKRQGHSLKSAAANIGAEELSAIAGDLESVALETDFSEIVLLETRMLGAFNRLKDKLSSFEP